MSSGFRFLLCLLVLLGTIYALASSKSDWSSTFLASVDASGADLEKAVQEVTADQIIHGTYSYDKEKTMYGAHPADASKAFREPAAINGKVFYKVAEKVLAPRNFKETGDIGTITVRYVVHSIDAQRSTVQIDAVFIDARNRRHPSEGSVEPSEYAAIHEHLEAALEMHRQAQFDADNLACQRKDYEARQQALAQRLAATNASSVSDTTLVELGVSVDSLRRQVVRKVNISGTELKAAPFKTASTLENLKPQTEVLVLILTQYWYGVETEDGHHGWVRRSELEMLP